MPYQLGAPTPLLNGRRIKKQGAADWTGGVVVSSMIFSCCGLNGLQSFLHVDNFKNWKEEAEWVTMLYNTCYSSANILYCLTNEQWHNQGHRALLNIGAKQISEFPNLAHGPHILSLWQVNIRNACGRYCNKYGEVYDTQPTTVDEVDDELANRVGILRPHK